MSIQRNTRSARFWKVATDVLRMDRATRAGQITSVLFYAVLLGAVTLIISGIIHWKGAL